MCYNAAKLIRSEDNSKHLKEVIEMLKWGNPTESKQAAERLNKVVSQVAGSRALYLLLVLAAFVLLSGAVDKWTG
jgi:hypothetical protein